METAIAEKPAETTVSVCFEMPESLYAEIRAAVEVVDLSWHEVLTMGVCLWLMKNTDSSDTVTRLYMEQVNKEALSEVF